MICTFHQIEDAADEVIRLNLVEGAVYMFRGIEGQSGDKHGWVVPPGPYRLIGCGKNVHTNQTLVAYRCLANGKMFFCTLVDWSRNFEVPKEPPAPQPSLLPEKVAGGSLGKLNSMYKLPNAGGDQ